MPEKTQMPEAYMYRWPAPTFKSFPKGQTAAYYMTQDICDSSGAKADHISPSQLSAKQTEYLSQTTDGPSGIHHTNGGAGSGGHAGPGSMAPSMSHNHARYKSNPTKLRMALLHRASAHVFDAVNKPQETGQGQQEKTTGNPKVGRQYDSQMHGISLKGTQRLPDDLKKTTCKRCDALFVPEVAYSERTENKSRDQREPWASARIVECNCCGFTKRYPMPAGRSSSSKLAVRRKQQQQTQAEVRESDVAVADVTSQS